MECSVSGKWGPLELCPRSALQSSMEGAPLENMSIRKKGGRGEGEEGAGRKKGRRRGRRGGWAGSGVLPTETLYYGFHFPLLYFRCGFGYGGVNCEDREYTISFFFFLSFALLSSF